MQNETIINLMKRQIEKFGVTKITDKLDSDSLITYMDLRSEMMAEEIVELNEGIEKRDAEEIADALIDLLVFNIETLKILFTSEQIIDMYTIVMNANYAKEPGVKPERAHLNPLGLPDMIKPEGWQAPNIDAQIQDLKDRLNAV